MQEVCYGVFEKRKRKLNNKILFCSCCLIYRTKFHLLFNVDVIICLIKGFAVLQFLVFQLELNSRSFILHIWTRCSSCIFWYFGLSWTRKFYSSPMNMMFVYVNIYTWVLLSWYWILWTFYDDVNLPYFAMRYLTEEDCCFCYRAYQTKHIFLWEWNKNSY